MIEIYAQISEFKDNLTPASKEYATELRSFHPNQMVRIKIYATKKQRSVLQNRWIHAVFRFVADNTKDPDWDTLEKAKRNVKMAMKFFKEKGVKKK